MKFPAEFIERLRGLALVSEVIGKRVPLKRHGREFQALCPFHKEKSPSFTVNDDKGFYHCFGCGAHGDAIGFLMEYERLSYPEAVERLAMDFGLDLPKPTPRAAEEDRKRASLLDVMEMAAKWFEENLASAGGAAARDYLAQRGIAPEIVREFRIGYAPSGREELQNALLKHNITRAQMVEAGLVIAPDQASPYDRFRQRVMFPIQDARGRVIAFGGRLMPGAAAPDAAKYLNSPETPLFHKGEVLYNHHRARAAAREANALLVVEGYMDVIALAQAGFRHAVAPLGTALTERHLPMLWKMTSEPTLCLDGDAAGQRAMIRGAELALPLLTPGCTLRFARLPRGEDPDTLVRNYGPNAMEEVIKAAQPLSLAWWNHAEQTIGAHTPEQKAALERFLHQSTDRIADATVRSHYKEYFRGRLWPAPDKQRKFLPFRRGEKGKYPSPPLPSRPLPPVVAVQPLMLLKRQLLAMLLKFPELLHEAGVEEVVAGLQESQAELDNLRRAILELPGFDAAGLKVHLAASGVDKTAERLISEMADLLPKSLLKEGVAGEAVRDAWDHAVASYTLTCMEAEYQATLTMAELTSEHLARCQELQQQIARLKRQRTQAMEKHESSWQGSDHAAY